MPVENLWPIDLDLEEPIDTPGLILRQQADGLRERTRELVEGQVSSTTTGRQLVHRFYLKAPAIDYRVPLFDVLHGIEPYPAKIVWTQGFATPREVPGPAELRDALREVFAHGTTRRTVGQLMAFVRDQGMPFLLVEDEEIVGEARTLARAVQKAREVVSQDSEVVIWHNGSEAGSVRNFDGVVTEHMTSSTPAR